MITALSPLDGRYAGKVADLQPYFSEYALIKYRLLVEVSFLMMLSAEPGIEELPPFTDPELELLGNLVEQFDEKEAMRIKTIEKTTNHDVKAVEYYLKEKLIHTSLKPHLEFIHFACTSEDINNLAYGLMLKHGMEQVMIPVMKELQKQLAKLASQWKKQPLMSMTHGQPATPTTVGKELKIFAEGLKRQLDHLKKQEYFGKLNGASGGFNAHVVAYPKVNWRKLSKNFVQNLGLDYNPLTTQIEQHDYQAELFNTLRLFNTVLLDLDRDLWLYISRGIFKQKVVKGEVGSSTMPHKVNPIDFENSEGNIGLANALLSHLSEKLPVSRMQRDLTDSTVQRNIGVALGYSLLAYQSTLKGLGKLELNKVKIEAELNGNWELLAEPIQTVMRKHAVPQAYEKLKELTRGKRLTKEEIHTFVSALDIPDEDKKRLLSLTPATYIGLSAQL
ncbi:adenylosuccinate lyase [Candidatus Peregrinibacteria bacterium]|nr:MAG: adenylosuccinate lyase [Candidatus Peregrinibacteria bacterium]